MRKSIIAILILFTMSFFILSLSPISAVAVDKSQLYLEIKYDREFLCPKYDISIMVDDNTVGTISYGDTFTKLLVVNRGKHKIVFYKSRDTSIFISDIIDINGDCTVNYKIKGFQKAIAIRDTKITGGVSGSSITMPNILHLDLGTAKRQLKQDGFININPKAYDDRPIIADSTWTVIDQNIPADSIIDKNDEIIITCWPTDKFLDTHFLEKTIKEAYIISDELNYSLEFYGTKSYNSITDEIEKMNEDERNLWLVSKIKMGNVEKRIVKLDVFYTGFVNVPDVTGLSLESALKIFKENNFSNIKFKAIDNSVIWNEDKWKVIYQSEPAGSKVQANKNIELVCVSYTSERTAIANGETISYSTPTPTLTPTNTRVPTATHTPIPTITRVPYSEITQSGSVETYISELKQNSDIAANKYEGRTIRVTGYVHGLTFRGARGGVFFLVGDPKNYNLDFTVTFTSSQTSAMKNIKEGGKYTFTVTCETVGLYSGFICRY